MIVVGCSLFAYQISAGGYGDALLLPLLIVLDLLVNAWRVNQTVDRHYPGHLILA